MKLYRINETNYIYKKVFELYNVVSCRVKGTEYDQLKNMIVDFGDKTELVRDIFQNSKSHTPRNKRIIDAYVDMGNTAVSVMNEYL